MSARVREAELSNPTWARFVNQQPSATAFHCPAWTRLISDCYGYPASVLMLEDSQGQTLGGMPLLRVRRPFLGNRQVSLPFTDACPPLVVGQDGLWALASALAEWHSRTRRSAGPLLVRGALPETDGWVARQAAVLHTLSLARDSASVFRRFKRTQVQQCIVKAERDGVHVRRGESFADLRLFYDLHTQTRRRLGAPVQPLRFFKLLWERLLARGLGFVLLAYRGDEPVAGAVFLDWNGTLVYKYSASDPRHWRLRPNHLVLWTAIRWACDNGLRTVDFGRTDLDNRGLREFKNGWGTREEPLVYSTLGGAIHSGESRRSAKAARLAGPLIRHSPGWLCRALGELFYRYAV